MCWTGLSPDLQDFEQIKSIARPTDVPDTGKVYAAILCISISLCLSLSLTHIHTGLVCDLLWSDPDKDIQGWGENDRGVSFTFGPDIVTKFLNRHDLDLICRAHQVYSTNKYIHRTIHH